MSSNIKKRHRLFHLISGLHPLDRCPIDSPEVITILELDAYLKIAIPQSVVPNNMGLGRLIRVTSCYLNDFARFGRVAAS